VPFATTGKHFASLLVETGQPAHRITDYADKILGVVMGLSVLVVDSTQNPTPSLSRAEAATGYPEFMPGIGAWL
jgi:hypothetical protein